MKYLHFSFYTERSPRKLLFWLPRWKYLNCYSVTFLFSLIEFRFENVPRGNFLPRREGKIVIYYLLDNHARLLTSLHATPPSESPHPESLQLINSINENRKWHNRIKIQIHIWWVGNANRPIPNVFSLPIYKLSWFSSWL